MFLVRNLVAALTFVLVVLLTTQAQASDLGRFLGDYGNNVLPAPWIHPNKPVDESAEQRSDRIQMIADLVAEEAIQRSEEFGWYWSPEDLAMAAFTKMWYESGRFRLKVHNGKIRGDHGKSVCLGQIMHGGNKLVGTDRDSTRRCIVEVMRHLVKHQRRCLNPNYAPSPWSIAKVFAGYGTGHSCSEGAYMAVKDTSGEVKIDAQGRVSRNYWARERSHTWWNMRKAWHSRN